MNIKQAAMQSRSVRVALVLNYASAVATKGDSIRRSVYELKEIFGAKTIDELASSFSAHILLIVSQAAGETAETVKKVLSKLLPASLVQGSRMFVLDPFDVNGRNDLIRELEQTQALPAGGKILQASLGGDAGVAFKDRVSQMVSLETLTSLEHGRVEEACSLLCTLNQLASVAPTLQPAAVAIQDKILAGAHEQLALLSRQFQVLTKESLWEARNSASDAANKWGKLSCAVPRLQEVAEKLDEEMARFGVAAVAAEVGQAVLQCRAGGVLGPNNEAAPDVQMILLQMNPSVEDEDEIESALQLTDSYVVELERSTVGELQRRFGNLRQLLDLARSVCAEAENQDALKKIRETVMVLLRDAARGAKEIFQLHRQIALSLNELLHVLGTEVWNAVPWGKPEDALVCNAIVQCPKTAMQLASALSQCKCPQVEERASILLELLRLGHRLCQILGEPALLQESVVVEHFLQLEQQLLESSDRRESQKCAETLLMFLKNRDLAGLRNMNFTAMPLRQTEWIREANIGGHVEQTLFRVFRSWSEDQIAVLLTAEKHRKFGLAERVFCDMLRKNAALVEIDDQLAVQVQSCLIFARRHAQCLGINVEALVKIEAEALADVRNKVLLIEQGLSSDELVRKINKDLIPNLFFKEAAEAMKRLRSIAPKKLSLIAAQLLKLHVSQLEDMLAQHDYGSASNKLDLVRNMGTHLGELWKDLTDEPFDLEKIESHVVDHAERLRGAMQQELDNAFSPANMQVYDKDTLPLPTVLRMFHLLDNFDDVSKMTAVGASVKTAVWSKVENTLIQVR